MQNVCELQGPLSASYDVDFFFCVTLLDLFCERQLLLVWFLCLYKIMSICTQIQFNDVRGTISANLSYVPCRYLQALYLLALSCH